MYAGRIYADFQNLDDEGRIRLDTAGSRRDLAATETELRAGAVVRLYTDDADDEGNADPLLTEGIVESSERGLVARVDWASIRHASRELEILKKRFFDTAVGDMLRALDGGALIGATTLGLCALDHLGYLRTGNGDPADFKLTVENYLTKLNPKYEAEWLWATRNGLAHVHGAGKLVQQQKTRGALFVHFRPEHHLAEVECARVLNVESFIADVIIVAWSVFNDFRTQSSKPIEVFRHILIVGQSDATADKPYSQMHPWLSQLDSALPNREVLEADIRKGLKEREQRRKSA
ncbi:hypothetical protein R5W23_000047 [Gemmata sp. JC673]|uniref:Uncharacterized protein n=1 Tax=Gemmata algarum TaxID=2975278 RepID=A0ABU5ER20_9BACT|nr:hypothetical protein [Gemmata algarum]MDY3557521.1 hypothetical protein [Gemmata algarum]